MGWDGMGWDVLGWQGMGLDGVVNGGVHRFGFCQGLYMSSLSFTDFGCVLQSAHTS